LQFDKEQNEHNNHLLDTTLVNPKSDRMYGQTYLFIVLGSFPPNIVDRAVSFAGTFAWMRVPTNNGGTQDLGGGNCGRMRPLLTHQRTHKSAGLQVIPRTTSQAFGLPDPSPSVRGHRCC
jgi:CubicO group peptidase (beta-lactamase class C family)